MPALMIRSGFFVFLLYNFGFSFQPHVNFIFGIFKVEHFKLFLVSFCGKQSGFVYKVFKVSSGKTGGTPCQYICIDIRCYRCFLHVYFQNFLTSFDIRKGNNDLSVETSRTLKSWIENIRAVCCRYQNNPFV